jgi:hypothetical protein
MATKNATAKATKVPKAEKLAGKPWKNLAPGVATGTLSKGVHYSSKPVNTNASASGVRLARDDKPEIPFVCYATLNVDRRVTTYIEGGAPAAGPFNQASSVIEGIVDEQYAGCSAEQRRQVLEEAQVLDSAFVLGGDLVDARLRQIFIPVAGEEPVLLTPLHSPPFSGELKRRTDAEKAAHFDEQSRSSTMLQRRIAILGIGGANNQNVGRNIYPMTRPLVFDAPRENPALRKAFAVHHKGLDLQQLLPKDKVQELITWRAKNRADSGAIESTMETRAEEEQMLRSIARLALHRAKSVTDEINAIGDALPSRASRELSEMQQGLLDPTLRKKEWPRIFAAELITAIEAHRPSKTERSLADQGDLNSLIDCVAQAAE